mgnify:FL=1
MNRDLKKFIPRVIKFLLPYFFVAGFTVIAFYESGEIFSIEKILNSQIAERKNLIYGPSYSNIPHYYKYAAVEKINPSVLILGSSRVLQFRTHFFYDSIPFYTAGGVFRRINQLRAFLESLPENKLPHTIIIEIDPWWFCSNYDNPRIKMDMDYKNFFFTQNFEPLNQWHQFYSDWWKGKISFSKIFSSQPDTGTQFTGISGIMKQQGFRKDGSRSYGTDKEIKKQFTYKINGAIDSIRAGNGIMAWSDSTIAINNDAVKELRILLRFCRKHKITVTGFIPPIHSSLQSAMRADERHYQHFFNLINVLYPVFRDYSFHIYDFTSVSSFGGKDAEMIDGVHGSEKTSLKLYLQLLRKDIYLNQYSDSTILKEILVKDKNSYSVFGNN